MKNGILTKKNILTIPNLLSLMRLVMIPLIAHAYLGWNNPGLTTTLLILSGITDVVDGFIARRYHMISDFGKILDPVADKLTQGVTLICLADRRKILWIPVALLAIKEILTGLTGVWAIRRTGRVHSAKWHGKVTTALLYAMMIAFVLWQDMPALASNALIVVCAAMMLLSFALYAKQNFQAIQEGGE